MARQQQRNKRIAGTGIDYSLLVVVVFLLGFGLVMLYSSSYYSASIKFNGDSAFFLKKQIVTTAIGLIAMIFFMVLN